MEIFKVKNQVEGGALAFDLLKKAVDEGAKTLGLATGSTPLEFYKQIRKSDIDLSEITSINLDEYVGLDSENEQSYHYFMTEQLFNHKSLKAHYVPNGMAQDLQEAVKNYDRLIEKHPIDFQILGIGRNGHIGFNEPGTAFSTKTHVVDLDASTIEANARFFEDVSQVPRQAISMGIASIMSAKQIILMAYGSEKADAIYKTVHGPVTEEVPATVLQNHDNVVLIIDEAAASKLD
ncbi:MULTISPECIES: glucosamine-6-phosphate deaminase [Streptococcus]|uniref:Glucosamine-6-phosphate deaminase n=1 Tax=Streptococcus caledonicus TaxID=2614158 RepID=A0ABW0UEP0_9STRE|nr:glucosamine-6-phosphate deaminase [Streptococcus sp. S784/96/1]